jgi:hypothetical protein
MSARNVPNGAAIWFAFLKTQLTIVAPLELTYSGVADTPSGGGKGNSGEEDDRAIDITIVRPGNGTTGSSKCTSDITYA